MLVEIDGLIGQYGSDSVSMYAVQAMAAHSSIWHQPSARRGRAVRAAIDDPMLLPMPSPRRNTARISEKVYTVAPKSSESVRVQITSAPSAVRPERPIAT